MSTILSIMKEQDTPTLFDIIKENPKMSYNDATKIQEDTRLANEAQLAQEKEGVKKYKKGTEIDYHRYWKNMYEEEKKKRQEAQGETTIVKGIGMNSPEMKDAQARIKELDNSLAIALEINESHQRYNGKLQTRVTELEEDNQKLSKQISDHIKNREDVIRKAGM